MTQEPCIFGELQSAAFVRLPTVLQIIPVGRSTLWEMIARGDFPPPVKLSARVSAWRSQDVFAFMAGRTAANASPNSGIQK